MVQVTILSPSLALLLPLATATATRGAWQHGGRRTEGGEATRPRSGQGWQGGRLPGLDPVNGGEEGASRLGSGQGWRGQALTGLDKVDGGAEGASQP